MWSLFYSSMPTYQSITIKKQSFEPLTNLCTDKAKDQFLAWKQKKLHINYNCPPPATGLAISWLLSRGMSMITLFYALNVLGAFSIPHKLLNYVLSSCTKKAIAELMACIQNKPYVTCTISFLFLKTSRPLHLAVPHKSFCCLPL